MGLTNLFSSKSNPVTGLGAKALKYAFMAIAAIFTFNMGQQFLSGGFNKESGAQAISESLQETLKTVQKSLGHVAEFAQNKGSKIG
ncbi:MAG: hypothetical protein KTR28_03830 [Micavibrio sp.]|nr:hypothetical protein [Micavibrio sp.]